MKALSQPQAQCLRALAALRGQWVSAATVAGAAGVTERCAWDVLRRMRPHGFVTWSVDPTPGSGRSVRYRITARGLAAIEQEQTA